jgi:hypothetical protein
MRAAAAAVVSILLAAAPARAATTVWVDGACGESGDGTARACGASGPFRTLAEGIAFLHARAGRDTLVLNVRGAHDGFDGVYREFVKLFGAGALPCTASAPCTIQGCPAAACGKDESFVVSGFAPPPRDGWTRAGNGADAVFSRPVAARGLASEWSGRGNQPDDAHYGAGSGAYNPVYLLEGTKRTPMAYGGRCSNAPGVPCGGGGCAGGRCDLARPMDGRWGFTCEGTPRVTGCTIHVNPSGAADPTAGHPIWIPDRNANLTMDARTSCPERADVGCPPIRHLTLRRMTVEGARWIAINYQNLDEAPGEGVVLDQVTIRNAPRYGLRTTNTRGLVLDRVTVEDAGRGMSFEPKGTFGLRLFTWRGGAVRHLTVRHMCAAGRGGGKKRVCDNCDPPWNDPDHTAWGGSCEAWDLKQSDGVTVSDLSVTDIGGGQRIDACHDVVVERGTITRTRNGLVLNQLTPNAGNGHVRTYNVTIRGLRMDANGAGQGGAIATAAGIAQPAAQRCITPLGPGEWLRILDNRLERSANAGVLLCYNTLRCRGGRMALGTCRTPGSTSECPGGTCEEAGPGQGRIEIRGNTVTGDGIWAGKRTTGVAVRNDSRATRTMAAANLTVRGNTFRELSGAGVFLSWDAAHAPGLSVEDNTYTALPKKPPCPIAIGTEDGRSQTCGRTTAVPEHAIPAAPPQRGKKTPPRRPPRRGTDAPPERRPRRPPASR